MKHKSKVNCDSLSIFYLSLALLVFISSSMKICRKNLRRIFRNLINCSGLLVPFEISMHWDSLKLRISRSLNSSLMREIKRWSSRLFRCRMIGGGRHMASRRRGSSPMIRANIEVPEAMPGASKGASPRRRRAVAVQDHKSCALIQTRLKLGELV